MFEITITAEFWTNWATAVAETVTVFLPIASALIAIPLSFYILRKIILMFPRY